MDEPSFRPDAEKLVEMAMDSSSNKRFIGTVALLHQEVIHKLRIGEGLINVEAGGAKNPISLQPTVILVQVWPTIFLGNQVNGELKFSVKSNHRVMVKHKPQERTA
jgi:hypothetical protein